MSIGMPSYCAGASQIIGSSEPAGYTEKKLIVNNKGVKMPDDGLAYELLRENRSLMLSLHDSEKNVAALKVEMKRINDAQVEITLKFANSEKEISRLTIELEDAEKEIVRLGLLLKT